MKKSDTVNLGAKRWRGIWVSKSDIQEYLRCKFRIHLSHISGIPISEFRDYEAIRAIWERGIEFESGVLSKGDFTEIGSAKQMEESVSKDLTVMAPQLFRNHELGIQGIPDLIQTRKGKLYPIEIKSHDELTELDATELAFYWKLLEPLRKGNPKPKGYVILGSGKLETVNIKRKDLWHAEFLIDEIRRVKKEGLQPTLSRECKLCTQNDDCRKLVAQEGGLSLIHGIAYIREQQLNEMGIHNIMEFQKVSTSKLNEEWYLRFGISPGENEISKMQFHANALINRVPIFFGHRKSFTVLNRPLIVMDLEYDPESYIWLAGICVLGKKKNSHYQYYAESLSQSEEAKLIEQLLNILDRYSDINFATYGSSADMPQLRKALIRHDYPYNVIAELDSRYIDLYYLILNNFRFPIISYRLKEIENYFGFERTGERIDGLLALGMYHRYLRLKDMRARENIRNELLKYNKDDLQGTANLVSKLESFVDECIVV